MTCRLIASLEHNLGPVIMEALGDPEVVEIMVNPDCSLWIERLGAGMARHGEFCTEKSRLVISLLASSLDTTATPDRPIVEGELPKLSAGGGSRFEGLLPPVVAAPSFAIRKRASRVFSLQEYVEAGILDDALRRILVEAIQDRRNILVAGGTGSGKTTFVNALVHAMAERCPDDRLVIIEDTVELQAANPNHVFLRTSDHVDMRRLVKASMRLRPTRILVGEVRDGAALDLLKAWNTGHPGGVATVHASSAAGALTRLEQLTAEALPGVTTAPLITEAVDCIVFLERTATGRRMGEAARVSKFDPQSGTYCLEMI